MTSEAILIIGVLGLSAVVSYAWWVRVRVILLQEDLFEIRDNLFDRARALNALDDPAYVEMRNQINALLRLAQVITVPPMIYLTISGIPESHDVQTDNAELKLAIQVANNKVAARFLRYLSFETATGLMMVLIALIIPKKALLRAGMTGVSRGLQTALSHG